MLMYVVLILLPATALAECDPEGYWNLFYAADANNDSRLATSECYGTFNIFDADKNGTVTVKEIKDLAQLLAPGIVGHETKVVEFIDQDGDGVLDLCDVIREFARIDTNKDGFKDKVEYTLYVDYYCNLES